MITANLLRPKRKRKGVTYAQLVGKLLIRESTKGR
ncbi:hypothetical protein J2X53_002890 [Pseudorhodobacter sp. 4114]|nr:hypothetical protein [Pseudorhodobacter sp. 4114]